MSETNHQAVAKIDRGQLAPVHPLTMLQQAIANGMDTETLKQLMELSERHDANEARKAYTAALVDLKRDLPTVIAHDKEVKFTGVHYTHTSLAAAMDAVTEPLTKHGFSIAWEPSSDDSSGKVKVTCRLTHAQGHSESCTLTAPIDNKGSKSPAQGIMSTITMLERYTALSLLGIATKEHQEPKQEAPPETINTTMNQRALKACIDAGHTRESIEEHIGKPFAEWTLDDLKGLKKWLNEQQWKDVGPPPMEREPGQEG